MRILDRYVVLSYLKSYLVAFVCLMLLIILFDFLLNIDEFFPAQSGAGEAQDFATRAGNVLTYYAYRVPFYFAILAGAITVIAAGFTLGRMSWANEFTALLASGVSLHRVLLPTAVVGVLLNLLLAINQELLLPSLKEHLVQERGEAGRKGVFNVDGFRDDRNNVVHGSFRPATGTLWNVRIIERRLLPDGGSREVALVLADEAVWSPDTAGWNLVRGVRIVKESARNAADAAVRPDPAGPVAQYRSNMTPLEIRRHRSAQHLDLLSYVELSRLARDPTQPQYLVSEIGVRMNLRITQPLVNILIMLTAVPLFLTREHRNIIVSSAMCMGIVGAGMGAAFFTTQWAFELGDPAWYLAGAWAPVALTAPAAAWSILSIRT